MKRDQGGQRGHEGAPGAQIEFGNRWWEIPPEVVWEFVSDLCAVHAYRGVAKMVDFSPETVRKYVERVGEPHRTTRKRFAELFLEHNPGGYRDMKTQTRSGPVIREFRTALPPGEENARATLAKIMHAARALGEELEWVDGVQAWLEDQLIAEYRGVRRNYEMERQARRETKRRAQGTATREEPGSRTDAGEEDD